MRATAPRLDKRPRFPMLIAMVIILVLLTALIATDGQ